MTKLRRTNKSSARATVSTAFQLLESLLVMQQIALPQLKTLLTEAGRFEPLEASLNLSAVPIRALGFGFGFGH